MNVLSFEKNHNLKHKDELKIKLNRDGINWFNLKFTKKKFFLIKIIDVIKISLYPIFLRINYKYDIVHCRGHIPQISGLILKTFFNVKVIFDCRGFWADERFDDNSWNKSNIIHNLTFKIFIYLEKIFFKKSDHIVILTNAAKNHLIGKNIINNKITVIPCCADYNKFQISSKKSIDLLKKELKFEPNDKIIGYIGSISPLYMIDEMLTFFFDLNKKKPNYKFLILTNQVDKMKSIIKKLNYKLAFDESSILIKSVDGNEIYKYINIFNASLCFVKSTFARIASSPTKIGESFACGIPIICNSNVGDLDILIPKIQKFGLHNLSDISNIPLAINDLFELEKLEKESIRNISKKYLDLNLASILYRNIYKKISN